jgi:SAM-dependent methyltransferase
MGPRFLPKSDILIFYRACLNCSFVFTTYMDNWTQDDFRQRIYNADYELLNPPIPGRSHVPFKETPSYQKGLHIARFFEGAQRQIRVLDFGAGGDPGPTGQALIDAGFDVDSYEPYRADRTSVSGKYQLIISIEVFEHCHDMENIKSFMSEYLAPDGVVWIETALHPHPTPDNILSSWYIAPRDGHISIHTFLSMTILFNCIGMNFVQTIHGLFAFRTLPLFPNRLFL